jgi:hypothetical protein
MPATERAAALRDLADYVNISNSRPRIGGKEVRKILTGTFFSPQMIVGRVRDLKGAATGYGSYNPRTAKYANKTTWKAMGLGLGTMWSIYAAADAAGMDPEIETDWRSADFGKVRVGETTFDPWAGYQQFIRTGAQLISGQQKARSSGRVREADRLDVLTRFVRSKLAPGPGMLVSFMTGSDVMGREAFRSLKSTVRAFAENGLPLGARDFWDIYKQDPILAAASVIPITLGMSVNAGIGRDIWAETGTVDEADVLATRTEVNKEIRDLKLNPPRPGRRVTGTERNLAGQKEYKSLDRGEYEEFQREVMPQIYDELEEFIDSTEYKNMTREEKIRALSRQIRRLNRQYSANKMRRFEDVKSEVRNRWWEE